MPHARGLLVLCLLGAVVASQNALKLTDSTFEKATQASTGQTTGHWQVASLPPGLQLGQ